VKREKGTIIWTHPQPKRERKKATKVDYVPSASMRDSTGRRETEKKEKERGRGGKKWSSPFGEVTRSRTYMKGNVDQRTGEARKHEKGSTVGWGLAA